MPARSHGMCKSREYAAWSKMIGRCCNPNDGGYPHYGGRGITVHPDWRHSFAAFFAYLGRKPSPEHSLDRIDVNGNYEPGNVRWAAKKVQVRNRRCSSVLTFRGVTRSIWDWAESLGLSVSTIRKRRDRGLPVAKILQPHQATIEPPKRQMPMLQKLARMGLVY